MMALSLSLSLSRKNRNTHDRNTKHGRGGRPPPRDGKREFDRRSGTGRGKEIKKGGGGARNWGSDKNEAKKMEGRINENEVVATKKEGGDEESKPTDSPKEAEPEKVVDNTISYSDYVASKGKKEEVAQREIENAFKGVTVAVSVEESFMVMGGAKQKKIKKKKDAEKKTIDVGFRVVSFIPKYRFRIGMLLRWMYAYYLSIVIATILSSLINLSSSFVLTLILYS